MESWEKGGKGAIDLAQKIVEISGNKKDFKYSYNIEDSIKEKIRKVAHNIYGASEVEYSQEALKQIEQIEQIDEGKYTKIPICIAKTQYSLSDDAKNLECKEPFNIHVKEISLRAGAEFIVVLTGKVMTMPGLPKRPAAEQINLDKKGNIIGIF